MRRFIKVLIIATLSIALILGVAMIALYQWQQQLLEQTFQAEPLSLSIPNAEAFIIEAAMESNDAEIVLSSAEVTQWIWEHRPPQVTRLEVQFHTDRVALKVSWKNEDDRYTNIQTTFSGKWTAAPIPIEESVLEELKWKEMNGYWTDIEIHELMLGEQNMIEWRDYLGFSTGEVDYVLPFWIEARQQNPELNLLFDRVTDCQFEEDQLRLLLKPLSEEP